MRRFIIYMSASCVPNVPWRLQVRLAWAAWKVWWSHRGDYEKMVETFDRIIEQEDLTLAHQTVAAKMQTRIKTLI